MDKKALERSEALGRLIRPSSPPRFRRLRAPTPREGFASSGRGAVGAARNELNLGPVGFCHGKRGG
jgi:hypothetical protein